MQFSLACEGATDYAVIESILLGVFGRDIEDEIIHLQPPFDETSRKQIDHGGWEILLNYLGSTRFRDDVVNAQYIIINLDSDTSEHPNFGVKHSDAENNELPIEELIANIEAKLVSVINSGQANFYSENRDKIIFCIAVHSIECWLCSIHRKRPLRNYKSKGCLNALKTLLNEDVSKSYDIYINLSKQFLSLKKINSKIAADPSLSNFLEKLSHIEPDKL